MGNSRGLEVAMGIRRICLADGWWLRGQIRYDSAIAKETLAPALAKITPGGQLLLVRPRYIFYCSKIL